MNTQTTCRRARQTLRTIAQLRHKSTFPTIVEPNPEAIARSRSWKSEKPNYDTYGSKIWVYNHLQKNHMVYSLTKSMRNNFSLRQLPFNGKKTVPPALRKDLWHPFATITFTPSLTTPKTASAIGLSVFQKLREYRRRHELEWDESMFLDKEGNFVEKKKRGRLLCDQKANSVADMAYVFSRLGEGGEAGENIGLVGTGTGSQVKIEWWDMRDAEFAETWSANVEHETMELQTNNRDWMKVWGLGKKKMLEWEAREGEKTRLAEEKVSEEPERVSV